MSLKDEYDKSVKEIKTDEYQMSIGEIANMYKDGDITIFPEYQRYFRWKKEQKSSFIESLILGMPTPSIFVSQDANGQWDVIDGLQRISTVLEFMGLLKNPIDNSTFPPSILTKTKFLPSLDNKTWANHRNTIGPNFRRLIKRRHISIVIVDSSSNKDIKYEMFQRLNTNGVSLSIQEIRNVAILMVNKDLFETITELHNCNAFTNIISMSTTKLNKQVDKGWISEFFVTQSLNTSSLNTSEDIGNMITEELINIAASLTKEKIDIIKKNFITTSKLLDKLFGNDAFKKYDKESQKYKGQSLQSMFEVLFRLTFNKLKYFEKNPDHLKKIQKEIPNNPNFIEATKKGTRSITRIKKLIKMTDSMEL